ncbi:MAG TPA: hypothetical protein VHB20_18675 [Verrucomicrobiae bacterium]|jgi:hypothetical protein|nr:hypothetical protein [Verrucomicrobiae bacterium]
MQPFRKFALLFVALTGALPALASDLTLEARLVWGVNETQDATHKPVAADLSSKLHGMFKWSNYFDITNQVQNIPLNQSRDFKMSDRCVLKIKNLGSSRIEVSCIGQGKEVCKGTHTLEPTQWLVLGGNDKNNTAWFIGLREADGGLAKVK